MKLYDGLPVPRRYWAVATIAIAVTMAVLDGAIANVALPTIAQDLGASPADSIWVVNAYQLAVTVTLLPLASLAEIVGFRRVYQVGLALFTLASLCCALSGSLMTLAAARVLQGLGASAIMCVNGALIRFVWPHRMLGRGIGYNAIVVAIASAVGPTVAAAILSVGSWPWLFAINVPLGLAAIAIGMRALPFTPRARHRFDIVSAVLNALTFGLLIIAIDGLGHSERLTAVALEFAGAGASAVALVVRQLHRRSPLLPIDLLRIPIFGLSVATSICSFSAQMLAFTALPFYLQDVLGRSDVATGLLMTPWPLAVAVAAPFAGRLADRHSAGLLGGLGMFTLLVGLLLLAWLPAHPANPDIVWRMAICGLGFGLFQSPNNRAMIGSAPRERSGGASGMLSTARLLGQTTGAALVAVSFGVSLQHGTTVAVLTAAGFAAAATVVSCLRMAPAARPAPAQGGKA